MRRKSGSHRRRRVDKRKVRLRFGRLEGLYRDQVTAAIAKASRLPVQAGGNQRAGRKVRLGPRGFVRGCSTVVASPGDLIGYQRRVEEIANRLRFQFALRE